ncbi:MAG: cellulase family glycosylhydrolase [Dehalococcoidia bacterium]
MRSERALHPGSEVARALAIAESLLDGAIGRFRRGSPDTPRAARTPRQAAPPQRPTPRRRRVLPWIGAALTVVALGGIAWGVSELAGDDSSKDGVQIDTTDAVDVGGPVPERTRRWDAVPDVRVQGNQLVDASGTPLYLSGVNRAGTEYACVQGWGIFDGAAGPDFAATIASWGANTVRVSLNEDCWLDRNGVRGGLGGEAYRAAIAAWVADLHNAGIVTVISLHWNSIGDQPATLQREMAGADHSLDFWRSVAGRFRDAPGVMYEVFSEPHDIDWDCWQFGCDVGGGRTASMQELVDAVRSSGSTQPIILSGIDYAADLTEWEARLPNDPAGQLVAGFHVYDFSHCATKSCWDATLAPIAERHPIMTVELGESACDGKFVESYIDWAEAHSVSWVAWTFNAWSTCSGDIALIKDETGAPTPLGEVIQRRLRS